MIEAREFYQSLIFNSEPFEEWERKGSKDDLTMAKEKADWILKNHTPVKLDNGISKRLDQIVKEATKA
jgi:trimethylamine:corrinoid methyltransferase-like protein